MKLYRKRIPVIAEAVIDRLTRDGDIEVSSANRSEAIQDLVSTMEEYLRRDMELREQVRELMATSGIGYEQYGKVRAARAEEWKHPVGSQVEKYLARQFIEGFMVSQFVDEVYGEDAVLWRKIVDILLAHDVDERELRDQARGLIRNLAEGTVDYEVAFQRALREVRKRQGLI